VTRVGICVECGEVVDALECGPCRERVREALKELRDVRIDEYGHGVPGVNAFYRTTITHMPSGLWVAGAGENGLALRRLLMRQLAEKVRNAGAILSPVE
jgi:hypothetical protein